MYFLKTMYIKDMDENLKNELVEHCRRQIQHFKRMNRTDSLGYKEHVVLLSFLKPKFDIKLL